MKNYKIDVFDEKQQEKVYSDFSENNDYITETAGFIPLDVKLQRFQETGQLMQFNQNEFTSSDYREMYLTEDFQITPEMDFEEMQEVIQRRKLFINELAKKKLETKAQQSAKQTTEPPPAGSFKKEYQINELEKDSDK